MTFIIAEIGQAHDGSLGLAHSFIEGLKGSGIDAIKFQTHIANAESSTEECFRVNFSYEDSSRYDYWKRMEFSLNQWFELKEHCSQAGFEFISSPFSNEAVNLLEKIDVKRYKIGSGEVNNKLLLEKISRTQKPVILSSGMSTYEELDESIEFFKSKNTDVSVVQCTTAYPTKPKEWGVNVLAELKSRYNIPVGFSDHSGDIYACLAAVALGAELLEFHIAFDQSMFGPDSKSSIPIYKVQKFVQGIRQIEQALLNPIDKKDSSKFNELRQMFGKSLSVNRDLQKGHKIQFEDLDSSKPAGFGIDPRNFKSILGKKLLHNINQWEFLNYTDVE